MKKLLIMIVSRILPVLISLFISAFLLIKNDFKISNTDSAIFFIIIVGFIIPIWIDQWMQSSDLKRLSNKVEKMEENYIELFFSEKERFEQAKSLYSVPGATIYATDLYTEARPRPKRDETEIAAPMYLEKNSANYIRIVSVNNDKDKEWIKFMYDNNKNPNYELKIIENLPENLILPNFLLIKQNGRIKTFVSYPISDREGAFAFQTISSEYTNGILQYLMKLNSLSKSVDICMREWGLS